ncbi:MAG: hypothetical protein ACOC3X_02550 [Nanoarchaeota archaeon]
MNIEKEIIDELNKDKDVYSKEFVDELIENDELDAKDGAFMTGYLRDESTKEDTEI